MEDKYYELSNLIEQLDLLVDDVTDKYYIDAINELKFEAQNDLAEIEPQFIKMQEKEYTEMESEYERSAI